MLTEMLVSKGDESVGFIASFSQGLFDAVHAGVTHFGRPVHFVLHHNLGFQESHEFVLNLAFDATRWLR